MEARSPEPSEQAVDFLVAEYNNQYEQFRHQDHLRISYLQIYFTLATVLFAGTGLAMQSAFSELPLVVLLAAGYVFMFGVGQLSLRMLISLRAVQLETAVLLDLIRVHLGSAFDVSHALLYFGALREADFYEPKASSTWVFRFISMLNGIFLAIGVALALGATWVQLAGDLADVPWWLGVVACSALLAVGAVYFPRRDVARLSGEMRRLQTALRVEERYARLGPSAPT